MKKTSFKNKLYKIVGVAPMVEQIISLIHSDRTIKNHREHKWVVKPLNYDGTSKTVVNGNVVDFIACCSKCLEKRYI
jgi:hypothetical protein